MLGVGGSPGTAMKTPSTPPSLSRAAQAASQMFFCLLLLAAGSCPAQLAVSPDQIKGGEFTYAMVSAQDGYEAAAESWNSAFGSLGSNVNAVSQAAGNFPVIYVTNTSTSETGMEIVMTFDFSASGQVATGVSGQHWMQSFSTTDVQPYFQRFYSVNGGKEQLIDQSPSWGDFPNEGDSQATGFYSMRHMGGEIDEPLQFAEHAKTFTYRIAVKFQNRKDGAEATIPARLVQPLRGTSDPAVKREPMVLHFTTQPAQK